jgi:hypothetical protein
VLSRERRLGLVVAGISTLVAVYAVELGLHVWNVQRQAARIQRLERISQVCPGRWTNIPQCQAAFELGEPFDARTRLEVLTDLEADGSTWWPAIHASLFRASGGPIIEGREVIPLAGISFGRTLLCNESGEWVTFIADEHGFNNPAGVHQPDAPVVVVGDSFVHGYCVPPDRTISALLDAQFPGTLNLGLAGAGPLTELAALREYAAPLRPALVVWAYFGENDLRELELEADNEVLRSYLQPEYSQGLAGMQPALDRTLADTLTDLRVERDRQEAERNDQARLPRSRRSLASTVAGIIKLRDVRRLWRRATRSRTPDPFPEELLRQVLETARDEVAAWDGELVFLLLPEWQRYGRPEASDPYYEEVLNLAAEVGLEVIDGAALFDAHPDPLSLFPRRASGHYTEEGYRLVADAIAMVVLDSAVTR